MAGAPVPLLIIGTFHFAGSSDIYTFSTDVTTHQRQAEIAELVGSLAGFVATKVLTEGAWDRRDRWQERYDAFRASGEPAGTNEIDQVAFRVAAALDHEAIFAVDVPDVFTDERFMELSERDASVRDALEALERTWGPRHAEDQALLGRATIGAFLRALNTEEARRDALTPYLDGYVQLSSAASPEDAHVGAEAVANWYRRNLKIFANICRVTEPDDRLLVLIGAGHVPLLRHFAEASGRYEAVDPLAYLP